MIQRYGLDASWSCPNCGMEHETPDLEPYGAGDYVKYADYDSQKIADAEIIKKGEKPMSKLDAYENAKTNHEALCDIISRCTPSMGPAAQYESAHCIQFLFRLPNGTEKYRMRLAEMLSKVCEARLKEIVAEAKKFSETDLAEKAQAAQAEAVETLRTLDATVKSEAEKENT